MIATIIDNQRSKFEVKGLSVEHKSIIKRKKTYHWPFTSCFLTCDGYVTPCCIRQDPSVFNFGNIFKMPFEGYGI